jgi:hypothetical protein
MTTRTFGLVLWIPVLAAAACGGPRETEKTGDETRSAAVEILPGTTVDDKISAGDDKVDWKRFVVDEATTCMVNMYWDNPAVSAKVTVRDMFGGPVAELAHQPAAEKDSAEFRLKDGTYFLEIVAASKASVYTVELILGGQSGSYGVPRPE